MYPALSVAQTLIAERLAPIAQRLSLRGVDQQNESGDQPSALSDMLWVGSLGGMEAELAQRAGLPFKAIHGGGVHGVGWRLPLNALNLARGFFEALR